MYEFDEILREDPEIAEAIQAENVGVEHRDIGDAHHEGPKPFS